eukprot:2410355-Rhodomonas_salina.2
MFYPVNALKSRSEETVAILIIMPFVDFGFLPKTAFLAQVLPEACSTRVLVLDRTFDRREVRGLLGDRSEYPVVLATSDSAFISLAWLAAIQTNTSSTPTSSTPTSSSCLQPTGLRRPNTGNSNSNTDSTGRSLGSTTGRILAAVQVFEVLLYCCWYYYSTGYLVACCKVERDTSFPNSQQQEKKCGRLGDSEYHYFDLRLKWILLETSHSPGQRTDFYRGTRSLTGGEM